MDLSHLSEPSDQVLLTLIASTTITSSHRPIIAKAAIGSACVSRQHSGCTAFSPSASASLARSYLTIDRRLLLLYSACVGQPTCRSWASPPQQVCGQFGLLQQPCCQAQRLPAGLSGRKQKASSRHHQGIIKASSGHHRGIIKAYQAVTCGVRVRSCDLQCMAPGLGFLTYKSGSDQFEDCSA
jgi:hypothetical protein